MMLPSGKKLFLVALQILCLFSGFLFFIGACILADVSTSRLNFVLISYSIIEMALACVTTFFLTKQVSSENYCVTITASLFTALLDLYLAVLIGASTEGSGKYVDAARLIVAGNSLLIAFKAGYIALLVMGKQQIVGDQPATETQAAQGQNTNSGQPAAEQPQQV